MVDPIFSLYLLCVALWLLLGWFAWLHFQLMRRVRRIEDAFTSAMND